MIKAGLDVEYFPIRGKGIKAYLKHIFILRKHLNNNAYDIFHAHYGLCGIVALFARRKGKLIVSFMGDDLLGSRNSKGKVIFHSKFLTLISILLTKHFYSAAIVKSEEMHERIRKESLKTYLIPNGVDLSVFRPIDKNKAYESTGWSPSRKHVIFVSDPNRYEKNYSLAKASIDKLNDPFVEFHIVNNIQTEQLIYYYNAADCVVLPSFHEGSPNVIKEAMACNCPIVSTDVGDVRWVMGNTRGCYIASTDPDDFAEKIIKALEFSEKYGRTNGRERILELGLDSDTLAKKIIDVYKSV